MHAEQAAMEEFRIPVKSFPTVLVCMQRQRRRAGSTASLQIHPPLSGEAVNKRRIVVTGMGVVTSLGHDVKELYDQLLEVGQPAAAAAAAAAAALPSAA